jgi:hypothetical protein
MNLKLFLNITINSEDNVKGRNKGFITSIYFDEGLRASAYTGEACGNEKVLPAY